MENQNEMQPFISSFKFIKICSIIILWLITIGHFLFGLYLFFFVNAAYLALLMFPFSILLIATIIETKDINKPIDGLFSMSSSIILLIYQIIITIIFFFSMFFIIYGGEPFFICAVIAFIYIIESCPLAIIICKYYCYKSSLNKFLQNLDNLNNNGLLQGI